MRPGRLACVGKCALSVRAECPHGAPERAVPTQTTVMIIKCPLWSGCGEGEGETCRIPRGNRCGEAKGPPSDTELERDREGLSLQLRPHAIAEPMSFLQALPREGLSDPRETPGHSSRPGWRLGSETDELHHLSLVYE